MEVGAPVWKRHLTQLESICIAVAMYMTRFGLHLAVRNATDMYAGILPLLSSFSIRYNYACG